MYIFIICYNVATNIIVQCNTISPYLPYNSLSNVSGWVYVWKVKPLLGASNQEPHQRSYTLVPQNMYAYIFSKHCDRT